MKVTDYRTGESLTGKPYPSLVAASRANKPTGAALAFRDEHGDWHLCDEQEREARERVGTTIRTVFVES